MPLPEIELHKLKSYKRNARTHSRKQIRQIAESIRTFGFASPILIDDDDTILAGHARVEAARLLGLKRVPFVRLSHLTTAQKQAFVLADNKLAANAEWDELILAEELQALLKLEIEFDLGVTGFSTAEIDAVIEGLAPVEPGDPAADVLPDLANGPNRCQLGDIWRLGTHRLACGDARDRRMIDRLMAGEKARMVFTDPPYNVPIVGNVGGTGRIKHADFRMGSGEMSRSEFTAFLASAFRNLAANTVEGSIHFVCSDWRHWREFQDAGEGVYAELKNLIIWVKDNGGMGTFYRSRHELIFAFKNGDAPHLNTFELGQHGRYRTNVWQYKGVNTMKPGRLEELALHPTVKPVQMIADAIKDVSARGDIVLDLFGGSGSTLIAAHKTGRRGYLCELDPIYCDRIIARWEAFAKDDAELALRTAKPPVGRGKARR